MHACASFHVCAGMLIIDINRWHLKLINVNLEEQEPQTLFMESSEKIIGCFSARVLFTVPMTAGKLQFIEAGHFICTELMECTHAKQGLTIDNDLSYIHRPPTQRWWALSTLEYLNKTPLTVWNSCHLTARSSDTLSLCKHKHRLKKTFNPCDATLFVY